MSAITNMVAVMQAFSSGKIVEQKSNLGGSWKRVYEPSWNWDKNEYRIADQKKYDLMSRIESGEGLYSINIRKKNEGIRLPMHVIQALKEVLVEGGYASFYIVPISNIATESIPVMKKYQKDNAKNFGGSNV